MFTLIQEHFLKFKFPSRFLGAAECRELDMSNNARELGVLEYLSEWEEWEATDSRIGPCCGWASPSSQQPVARMTERPNAFLL